MRKIGLGLVVLAFALSLGGSARLPVVRAHDDGGDDDRGSEGPGQILTIDHLVPHTSTALANRGELVHLFVRERVRRGHSRHRPVVLMIEGATLPAVPDFDLRFENYSWMDSLARAGFDVFAMDLQGYGFSHRPRMDEPCNTQSSQQSLLIPYPLSTPCPPSYPFKMAIQSDWDEIDRVVDFARQLRDVDTVSIVAWSRGGPRAGAYAARHPEKVDKLILYAPAQYNRSGPSTPRALPEPGFIMQLGRIPGFYSTWDGQVGCENQFTPEIRSALRTAILESDQLGATWGDGESWRAPLQNTLWGWNAESAQLIETPTLIIRGEFDSQAPEPPQRDLFADLGTDHKVFVNVACASHYLVWENQHQVLLRASQEWLREGTFDDQPTGSFFVDAQGRVQQK